MFSCVSVIVTGLVFLRELGLGRAWAPRSWGILGP